MATTGLEVFASDRRMSGLSQRDGAAQARPRHPFGSPLYDAL